MATTLSIPDPGLRKQDDAPAQRPAQAPVSAVSWGVVLAGAGGALAVSGVLAVLGAAVCLTAIVSIANGMPADAGRLVAFAVGWLITMQLVASAFGGYLSGYVRHRSAAAVVNEPIARDGLHGLLAWAVASLIAILVFASTLAVLGMALQQVRALAQTFALGFLASLVAGAAIAYGAAVFARYQLDG